VTATRLLLQVSPSAAASMVRRLRLLQDFHTLAAVLLRSEAVAGFFRALATSAGPGDPAAGALPVPWWDTEADLALLAGQHRHGLHAFDALRHDARLAPAFQVSWVVGWVWELGSLRGAATPEAAT
jgi:hypothetical protein